MEDEILLKKQIKTARTMLFIGAAATAIAAILIVPQGLERWQILDLAVTAAQAVIYFLLGLWTRQKPYTAVLIGLGLCIVMILAAFLPNVPGIATHWAARIITLVILLLAVGDSKDAQRKMQH